MTNTEDVPRTDLSEASRFDMLLVAVGMSTGYTLPFYLFGFSLPLSATIGVGLFIAMIALMGWTLKGFIESVKA